MLILSATDINAILISLTDSHLQQLHDDLSQSFIDASSSVIHLPRRTIITTSDQTTSLIMSSSDERNTSVKTVVFGPDKPSNGAINLYSADGELLGLLNAAETTAFRTALATMTVLSRTRWSRGNTSVGKSSGYNLVVFGAGRQAEWHVRLALRFASLISTVVVITRSRRRTAAFQNDVLEDLRKEYPKTSFSTLAEEMCTQDRYQMELRTHLGNADIVCCGVPSTEPLFLGTYLLDAQPKPRFISLIGSYKPHMQEVDTATILSGSEGRILVDSANACMEEAGEIIMGKVPRQNLVEIGLMYSSQANIAPGENGSELRQLLSPEKANVVFKCVGTSLMDLVIARALLDIAGQTGEGKDVGKF